MRLIRGWSGDRSGRTRVAAGARLLTAACSLLVLGACATRQPAPAPGSGKVVDLNADTQGDGKTKLRVDNQNLADMTIYAYNGSQRLRLGRAAGNTTTDLVIPSSIVSGVTQLRFFAEPMGNQRGYLSEPIPVQPGDLVDFFVPVR
jgi:hypothetical protein